MKDLIVNGEVVARVQPTFDPRPRATDQAHGRAGGYYPVDASVKPASGEAETQIDRLVNDVAVGLATDRLRSFIERIERLNEEKAALALDIREVYASAKGNGFDTKVMTMVIRLRAMDTADREEQEAILELYSNALGL